MRFFQRNPDLRRLMEREDVQGLIKALSHATEEARGEIVQILADMRDPRATEALMREAEQSDNMSLRRLAAEALKRVDPDRKYIAAVHLLGDVHRSVRTAAIGLLAATGNPKALDALASTLGTDRDAQARAAAAKAIGHLRDRRGVQPLITALNDADERVRLAAIEGLLAIGDRAALPGLMQAHEQDPHPEVRVAAEKAIATLQH